MKKAELILVGMTGDLMVSQRQSIVDLLSRMGLFDRSGQYQSVEIDQLREAFLLRRRDADLTLIIGGVGSLPEDRSIQEISDALGIPLEYDDETGAKPGGASPFSDGQSRVFDWAWLPQGALLLENNVGTAPGCIIELEDSAVVLLPGKLEECAPLLQNRIQPYRSNILYGETATHTLMVFGHTEKQLAEKLKAWTGKINPTLTTAGDGLLHRITVSATARDRKAAEEITEQTMSVLFKQFGTSAFGADCDGLEDVVVNLLQYNRLRISTAESCTGGQLSASLVNVPGASKVFDLGVTTYAADKKVNILKVPVEIIQIFGEVSAETAVSMASGVQQLAHADIGVGITGVAGPDGGSEEKPVGLVYIAIADKNNALVRRINLGSGKDRKYIRETATQYALDFVRKYLMNYPKPLKGSVPLRELGDNIRKSVLQSISSGRRNPYMNTPAQQAAPAVPLPPQPGVMPNAMPPVGYPVPAYQDQRFAVERIVNERKRY